MKRWESSRDRMSLADQIRTIVWVFDRTDSRRDDLRVLADKVDDECRAHAETKRMLAEERRRYERMVIVAGGVHVRRTFESSHEIVKELVSEIKAAEEHVRARRAKEPEI